MVGPISDDDDNLEAELALLLEEKSDNDHVRGGNADAVNTIQKDLESLELPKVPTDDIKLPMKLKV